MRRLGVFKEMVKDRNFTLKALKELKESIDKTLRRKKYTKSYENEVRTIINRLNIITKQGISLTSLNKQVYPREIPIDWYKQRGNSYFEISDFDPKDEYYKDEEHFLFYRLK